MQQRTTHLVSVLGVRSPARVSGTADERIAAVAARQRGRIARRQLHQAGVDRGAIRRRVRRGALIARHRDVFTVGHATAVAFDAETVALLAVRGGALLSHRSAAVVWGLLDPERDAPVHVVVAGGAPAQATAVIGHRSRSLPAADIRVREGLPVTSVMRTALDLADAEPARTVERAVNQARALGLLHDHEVDSALTRAAGRRGVALVRELTLGGREAEFTRSLAEERLLELIADADLPRPRVNTRLHDYEVDLYWPQARLVVEVDGWAFHRSRAAFERDRLRDARLQAAGIEVLRVTWRQLENEPLALVARIASALTRRSAEVNASGRAGGARPTEGAG